MHTRSTRNIFLILGLTVLFVVILEIPRDAQATSTASAGRSHRWLASQIYAPTLTTAFGLTPTSTPLPEAQKALAYTAQREGIPIDNLLVANEFRRNAPLLSRTFWP